VIEVAAVDNEHVNHGSHLGGRAIDRPDPSNSIRQLAVQTGVGAGLAPE